MDRQFEDYLPAFAAVSLCIWALILDGTLYKEMYFIFWVIDFIIQGVLSVWGVCHILAALWAITGSALNSVQYILSVYVTKNPSDYFPEPPIIFGPVYWLNALEIRIQTRNAKAEKNEK